MSDTKKPWVKLHLAKQADSCNMPPAIIGILQQELPNSYMLSNVLEVVPDEKSPSGYVVQERQLPDYVNRTYVYRVEILGIKPDLSEFYRQDTDGFIGDFGAPTAGSFG